MLLDVPIGNDVWTVAHTMPNSVVMGKIRDKMREHDIFSFFPNRKVQRHLIGGKTKVYEQAEVAGYIITKLTHLPDMDKMREQLPGFRGFVMRNGLIATIHPSVAKKMQGLSVEAQELEAARKDMFRVREGDMARFITGALAGHMVEVAQIGQVVTVLLDGRKVKTDLGSLERVV
jgi:transcription antitermination factor NusG